jgi:uncharacterized protein (TIGR02145 family)
LPNNPYTGNNNIDLSISISNLNVATIYHYRIKAINAIGTTYGDDFTFTTLCDKPSVSTLQPSSITGYAVVLNGSVNPNGLSSTIIFEYGLTNSYGNSRSAQQSPLVGNVTVNVNSNLDSLIPNSIYHFRVKASNTNGISYGSDLFFTTLGQVPTVTTNGEQNLGATNVTLQGLVNPNYLNTSVVFEYGTSASYGYVVNANESPLKGSINQTVTANLDGLINNTIYHYRIKATNDLGISYGNDNVFTTYYGNLTDIDGNVYNTVQIVGEIWMVENLKVTHYQDGSKISNITDDNTWNFSTVGGYCWYLNDSLTYKETYGALYNWPAVIDVRNICPNGWHISTDSEWTDLVSAVGGGLDYAGGKLKETGYSHWKSPNTSATNQYRFTGLPGGARIGAGSFINLQTEGYWWTSTSVGSHAFTRWLIYNSSRVGYDNDISELNETGGMSIRCIKN